MGTRSLTHIKDGKNIIATIYRQFDGYPTGIGADIKKIIGKSKIVNGISGQNAPAHFNGMGCLAAYLVGELKGKQIGSVYLFPPGSEDCGEEYTYTIYLENKVLHLKVDSIYDGPISDFDPKKVEAEDTE